MNSARSTARPPIPTASASAQRSPSQSSEVSMTPSGYSGFGGMGRIGAGLSDGDFKDTVLYMQQQQALHHQQLLDTLQQVLVQVSAGGGNNGGAQPLHSSSAVGAAPDGFNNAADEPTDVPMPPLGADYAASRYMNKSAMSSAGMVSSLTSSETDIALRAAQGKIVTLEAQVQSLQAQVLQQEATIRQLTEANINNVRAMAQTSALPHSANKLVSSVTATTSTPHKAVNMHRQSVDNLLSGTSATPNRNVATAASIVALTTGATPTSQSSTAPASTPAPTTTSSSAALPISSISTPNVRELLSQHQQRCNQVLLQ